MSYIIQDQDGNDRYVTIMNVRTCDECLESEDPYTCEHTNGRDVWAWAFCFPGCLPDGDLIGEFETPEAAYDAAKQYIEEMD